MSKSRMRVGVDVGAKDVWAAVHGRKAKKFKHTKTGIKSMHKWASKLADGATVHFCMEATGVYGESLAHCLHQLDHTEISIINPARICAYAKAQLRRAKTDAVDCQVILSYADCQQPPLWRPARKTLRQMYQIVAQMDAINKTMTQIRNREHANRWRTDTPSIISKSDRSMLRFLKTQLGKLDQELSKLCRSDDVLTRDIKLLLSIPGIGKKTAVRLLAYAQTKLTEYNRQQMTAQAGLAPRPFQSGTSVHKKSHIAKQGDRRLRASLFMPAMVATKHNPIIREHYQRMLDNGKMKMEGLVACMRKLLLMACAVLKTRKTFNPTINT